jgi:tetratricopeptide (TPR) repeat protein
LVANALSQVPPSKELFAQAIVNLTDDQIVKDHKNKVALYLNGFRISGDRTRFDNVSALFSQNARLEEDQVAAVVPQLPLDQRRALIERYENGVMETNLNNFLSVAISYFLESQYDKSAGVYRQCALQSPDDLHVLKGLGNCFLFTKNFEDAIVQYRRAVKLGDADAIQSLALAYIGSTNSVTRMEDLIPALMKDKRNNLVIILTYSLRVTPPDRRLFMQAIDGLSDDELTAQKNTAQLAILGLNQFGYQKRAEDIKAQWNSKASKL